MNETGNRYFRLSGEYVVMLVVASSADDARRVLVEAGIEWEDGTRTFPDPYELTGEVAAKVIVTNDEDAGRPRRFPLTECKLGEWFWTEC